MVTIKDMAEKLGLSTTTVSNVIHGKTNQVSAKTIEKVEKLLKEYDYVPNINARNLAQNQTKIICVTVKSRKDKYPNILADPFFGSLIGAIEADIRKKGYYMMLYISNDILDIMKFVSSWNADGVILIGMLNDDYVRIRSQIKRPMVLIDSYTPDIIKHYINIGLDDDGGSYNMTKYLIECGHREIAFLADNMEGVDYHRYQGHIRALIENDMEPDEKDLIIIRPGEEKFKSLEEILEISYNYTAFMVCSDAYAVLIMNYLMDAGRKIPDDISITGFDDIRIASIIRPALTTVAQDIDKKGKLAVDTLIDIINGEGPDDFDIRLPVKLVIRDSVKDIRNIKK